MTSYVYKTPLRVFIASEETPAGWGWAALLTLDDGEERAASGIVPAGVPFPDVLGFLKAAIAAYGLIPEGQTAEIGCPRIITNALGRWVERWDAMGWKTKSGEPVAHADEWSRLDYLELKHRGSIAVVGVSVSGADLVQKRSRTKAMAISAASSGAS